MWFSITEAQEDISPKLMIAPHTFELDVFAGETRKERIKVYNQSDVAIPISTRIVDFTAEEESGYMIFDESVSNPSIAARKWIKIENPKFILDPKEVVEVKFSIEVPKDAESGGHYAVILFDATLPDFYFKEDQPKVTPSLGALVMLSVKTLNLEPTAESQKIEIVEFGIPKEQKIKGLEEAITTAFQIIPRVQAASINIVEKSPSGFTLRIKNNDIFHHKLEGKLLISNMFGKKIGEMQIKSTTILPGKIRKFPIEFRPEIPKYLKWLPAWFSNLLVQNASFGSYHAVLGLSEEKEGLVINQTLGFWALPWKLILLFVLITALFIVLRKRIISVFRILLKP